MKTILVVDDDSDVTECIAQLIELQGCKVLKASNGQEAYERFLNSQVHGILADVEMPLMSGVLLLKKIRQICQLTPVVLMSGRVQNEKELLSLGASLVVSKPITDLSKILKALSIT